MNISEEMISKEKTAASAAELQEMAREYNIDLSESDTADFLDVHNGNRSSNEDSLQELSAVKLEMVAGGKRIPSAKFSIGQRIMWSMRGSGTFYGTITDAEYDKDVRAWKYSVCLKDGFTRASKLYLEEPDYYTRVIS